MNNEEKILSMLETLITEQQRTNQRLGGLEQGQAGLEQRLGGLEQGQSGLEQRLGGLEQGQVALQQGQAGLDLRLGSLEQGQEELKAIVLKIENEHGEKLNALFDSHKMLYDIIGEVRKDVVSIKSTLEKHELQIKWLDAQKKTS